MVRETLNGGGYKVRDEQRLPNNTGSQLRLESGQIINVFDNGTCSVQGRPGECLGGSS